MSEELGNFVEYVGGPEYGHRVRRGRSEAQKLDHLRVNGLLVVQSASQLLELGTARQFAEPEQVTDLLEGGVPGQILDFVTTIDEAPLFTVDVAQLRLSDDDALQPSTRHGPLLRGDRQRNGVSEWFRPHARVRRGRHPPPTKRGSSPVGIWTERAAKPRV